MEQAIGTRIGASSWRGTKPSSSVGLVDCFVVPPRKDTSPVPSLRSEAEAIQKKGATKEDERLDCFVVSHRKDGKVGSSWRGTKPASSECMLDCFVVPPRNDAKSAPSLRTEGEAIQGKGANEEYEQLDCFVVPPRNDGSRSFGESPLNDGAIVYSARALLRNITGKLRVYDDDCSGGGSQARMLKGETTQGYILLPNPNHGQFELRQLIRNSDPVKIEVIDILGRTIFSGYRIFQNGRTNIDLGGIVPGLYCLKLFDGSSVNNFKFVVQ